MQSYILLLYSETIVLIFPNSQEKVQTSAEKAFNTVLLPTSLASSLITSKSMYAKMQLSEITIVPKIYQTASFSCTFTHAVPFFRTPFFTPFLDLYLHPLKLRSSITFTEMLSLEMLRPCIPIAPRIPFS